MAKMNSLIKKLRNTTINIEFIDRQIIELELNKSKLLNEEVSFWEKYYQKKIDLINSKLTINDKNYEKRNKVLKKDANKLYWQRRKYLQENKNSDNLESLTKAYDLEYQKQLEQLNTNLDSKYPKILYNEGEENNLKSLISKYVEAKVTKIAAAEFKNEKRIIKIDKKIAKYETRKTTLLNIKNETIASINTQNETEFTNKSNAIDVLEVEIKNLEQLLNEPSSKIKKYLLEKKLSKAKNNLELSKLYLEISNDEEIHLAVSDLKMHFGGIKALDGVTFNVKKGEIFGLIGPNGAGKTTVFNCITQFYTPTAGNILFRNKEGNITNLDNIQTHNIIKEGIARSFQNIEMVWELTVLDNLLVASHSILRSDFLGHMIHSNQMKKEEMVLRQKGYEILTMLGVSEYAFRSPYGLPYGILKKVELARTLMTNPSMIILDEPAAGLNDIETIDLAKTIKKINEELKVTIFLVEHDMQLVMSISNTVCAINFGKMLAIGTSKEIQNHEEVRRAYLGDE